jgi:DNA primase
MDLKTLVPISDVVKRSVAIKKHGNEWRGCCPFHNEATPSFTVSDDKAFFHCFGCGAHGDACDFLSMSEGLTFPDAKQTLADMAGVTLPTYEHAEFSPRDALTEAQEFFRTQVTPSLKQALSERGVSSEAIDTFGIGFAPDHRRSLKGSVDILVQAGLVVQVEGKQPYDRFRNRITIPIHDARGRIAGFTGRALDDIVPKYLNSPTTSLFDKGSLLFNWHRAIRGSSSLFVVEGHLDAIAMHQHGYANTVATMGTALTDKHVALLNQVNHIILMFDGDPAGKRATHKAVLKIMTALTSDKLVDVVILTDNLDPDDMLNSGKTWEPVSLLDYLWEYEETRCLNPAHHRDTMLHHIGLIPDETLRKWWIFEINQRISHALSHDNDVVMGEPVPLVDADWLEFEREKRRDYMERVRILLDTPSVGVMQVG